MLFDLFPFSCGFVEAEVPKEYDSGIADVFLFSSVSFLFALSALSFPVLLSKTRLYSRCLSLDFVFDMTFFKSFKPRE